MNIKDKMQATLVSFYGKKQEELGAFILACQNQILQTVGVSFLPYQLEQVHGTIIGLEGYRIADKIKNTNFETYLSQSRLIDPGVFLEFARSKDRSPIDINIGGYLPEFREFTSRDQEPYQRSFCIQDDIVVVMGWPAVAASGQKLLDKYRRSFNKVNVLHKWHRTSTEIDDDFYLVLGRLQQINDKKKDQLIKIMRQYLSEQETIEMKLDRKKLSVVGYIDPQLPLNTSNEFSLMDHDLTVDKFLDFYPKT